MKLDRNINPDGRGKYALIKLRVDQPVQAFWNAPHTVRIHEKAVDYGDTPDTEFFVIRLKDKHAGPALRAYAASVGVDDQEFAKEVEQLALRAEANPNKKKPD